MKWLDRRTLFGVLGGVGLLALGFARQVARASGLRPPGALEGDAFLRSCIRCFRCAEVCPTKAIQFESSLDPRISDLPFIEPRTSACVLCMKCTEVCPTGALTRIAAEPDAILSSVCMGRPILDRDRCLPWKRSGVCRVCFYVCPYAGQAIRLGGPLQAPIFDAKFCVGCGLCEEACPTAAQAIHIEG